MEKTRKPEVKLEVDRAVDRSVGVAGLREIGSDICGAWEGSGCLAQPNRWISRIMALAIRLHKVSAIFFICSSRCSGYQGNLAIA